MGWNGLDLVNDFSSELGDQSSQFKTKCLRWINEGIKDIATSHQWPFLREKAKVLLVANSDTHAIALAKPSAPTVAPLLGGSLALATSYRVLVTFFESQSGVESIAGVESLGVTPLGANLAITVSDIPVSTSPLVTARKVYVSVNGAAFQYHGMINNNLVELPGTPDPLIDPPTPVVYEVTAPPSSQLTPPEENAIHMIDGDFYLEGDRSLLGTTVQNIIYRSGARNTTGTPEYWAPVNQEEILVYPKPTADTVASFFYFKLPAKVFGLASSVPQLPSWLYEDLRRYVIWRGYEFRDRAGKESKQQNYQVGLSMSISKKGKALKKSGSIRNMTPDSDGRVY